MFIIAGIVTYEPDLSRLRQNLASIHNQVAKVVIYDNGSSNKDQIVELARSLPNVSAITSSENDGIALALNKLAERAIQEGASYLLTLDQDSVAICGMVLTMERFLVPDVGMVTPYIVDRNKMSLDDYRAMNLPSSECYSQPARRGAITSGALLSLNAWREIGGFDERFFIDYVDYDFNQRLMTSGHKILRANGAALLHEVGRAKATWLRVPRKDLAGQWHIERFFSFGHSPSRCYYKARNRVLFTRKHGRQLGLSHEGIWQLPQQIALTIIFERQRGSKLRNFAMGIRDGMRASL